jgi:uncharacterized membrane protein
MFSFLKPKALIDKAAQEQIVNAVKIAESHTSGEIRVYMERHCNYLDPVERAREVFGQLNMEQTVAHNAILIYIALEDRQFALYGGSVIFEKAGGSQFWEKAAGMLKGHLQKNEVAGGVANCIIELGHALAEQFPANPEENENELPDEIVFGK